MKTPFRFTISHIYCDSCPAPWAQTPDSDCLSCDYFVNTCKIKGRRKVICTYALREELKNLESHAKLNENKEHTSN